MVDLLGRRPTSASRMRNLRLSEVQVVLAESRPHVRAGLKGALSDAGLHDISDAGRISTLTETVTQAIGPDIVICDLGLAGDGEVCEMVRALRHNEIGCNPFMCIIGITWNPTAIQVDGIINAGVDNLLAAPFSPQQVLDRVDALVHNRMPFVVTSDYVGPDRRAGSSRKTTIPMLEVPNSFRLKALGEWNLAKMRNAIEDAVGKIKSQKAERQAEDIINLAEQVIAQSAMPGPDMSRGHLERLLELLAALDRHAQEENKLHLCDLCRSAIKVVAEMNKTYGARREKDLQLLHQLAMAIHTAAQPRLLGETAVAHDIATTVNRAR